MGYGTNDHCDGLLWVAPTSVLPIQIYTPLSISQTTLFAKDEQRNRVLLLGKTRYPPKNGKDSLTMLKVFKSQRRLSMERLVVY